MRNSLQLYWLLLILLLPIFGGITLLLSVRTKDRVNRQILEGFDSKLSEIITLTDVFLDGDRHREIAQIPEKGEKGQPSPEDYDAEDPFYLKSVEVFKQIRKQTGLTYLYTLVLLDQENLRYILDGSEPDDFTPIGTQDTLPPNLYEEMKAAETENRSLIKPVEEWENWGLIKTGFTPIHHSNEQTSGFIGADIAVDIILTREKQATLALMLSGALGILISIFAAIRTTRNIARPINRLKEEVMQLAGGNPNISLKPSRISEYAHLTKSYQTIQTTFSELDQENREIIRTQRLQALETRYTSYMDAQLCSAYTTQDTKVTIRETKGDKSFSCLEDHNGLLVWQFPRTDSKSPLLSAKIRTLAKGLEPFNFDHYVEALKAVGYLATVNLIYIDRTKRQLSCHLLEGSRIARPGKEKTAPLLGFARSVPILATGDPFQVFNIPEGEFDDHPEMTDTCLEIQIQP